MTNGHRREAGQDALWYGGFAILALAVALVDEAPLARRWGSIASVAYVAGALGSLGIGRTATRRTATAIVVFAGAAVLPLGLELWWRAENGLGTHAKSETVVTEESARAMMRGADPYAADYSQGPLARFPAGVDAHRPIPPRQPDVRAR